MIRIGMIGCGAAAQQLHLPALQRVPGYDIAWIVDTQSGVAARVAARLGAPHSGPDYREVRDVDAVVVSTPHSLHATMTRHFLEQGVHVLCEKPLGLTVAESEPLVALAAGRRLVLAVGVFRRYYPVSDLMKRVVDSAWLGRILRVDVEEGGAYDWNLQSRFMMDKALAGGGVLVDTGAHTIDRVLWLLGGDARLVRYADNTVSGLETDCELTAVVPRPAGDVPIRVELSRTRLLENRFLLEFEHGRMTVPANGTFAAVIQDDRLGPGEAGSVRVNARTDDVDADRGPAPYFEAQLRDFGESVRSGNPPLNGGQSAMPCVRLIEACYASRSPMAEPWASTEWIGSLKERAS